MNPPFAGYQSVLAATDFSADGAKAVQRAVWVAQQSSKRVVVAHVVADLKKAIHHTSYRSRLDFLEGKEEDFQRELRRDADEKLKRQIAALGQTGLEINYETLLGEPYEELIHSVQQESYDLVVAGMRGHSVLKHFVLGSTAKRLVHHCPASVWIVRDQEIKPPAKVLAAVDMSDVSGRALSQAIWTAQQAGAELHIVHVIESTGLSADVLDRKVAPSPARSAREVIESEVAQHFEKFLADVNLPAKATKHLLWGAPAHETVRVAKEIGADLIVTGTVGRRGMKGLLLGNTAENVLMHCECDVLTVKPADFVSAISPASWQLHPGPKAKAE
jgi:nucleotide-binding universal stress UspA family protein